MRIRSWLVGVELETGELWRRRVAGPPSRIPDVLGSRCEGARLVYEAEPTGFGLARAGLERGVDVLICSPGSVPRASGDRVKTDRRDAERLLGSWRAGQLSFVRVPTVAGIDGCFSLALPCRRFLTFASRRLPCPGRR